MAEAVVAPVAPVVAPVVPVVTAEGLRRRRRLEVSRERLTVRLSAGELAEIGVAARRAGLTRSGFVASAALRAARGVVPVAGEEGLGAVVGEATRALDDVGVNLNQAVRRLNATGVAPAGLGEAVAAVQAATVRVEAVSAALLRRLVWRRRGWRLRTGRCITWWWRAGRPTPAGGSPRTGRSQMSSGRRSRRI